MNLFGFTKQEYDIIRKLLKITKKVNVTVCTDSLILDKNPEIDIFYSNKQTAEKLMNIANEEDVKIEKSVFLDNKKARFKSEELLHIEQNLYSIKQRKYEELPKNLSIFLANNQYSEVEYVASKIVELVKEKKYRYKDISIITKNLDTYSNLCKAIFDEYDIPVFIDQKKDLSDNILVQYILAVLDIFSKNWSHEAVFNYIKTGFLQMEQEDIYELENFCMKWGIKQTKWYKGEWNFKEDSKNDEDRLEKMKNLRKLIVEPLLNFKTEVDRSRDVTTITKCLYDFLIKNKIDEKLENKIKVKIEEGNNEAAAEYKTSYKILMDVLDEIVLVFGND